MISPVDIDTLARTIYGEARGEDDYGKRLVGYVMLNRWRTKYRGCRSIKEVCHDPYQFSCWNAKDPNRQKLIDTDYMNRVLMLCLLTAGQCVIDTNPLTATTRHYYAKSMPRPPFWARGHTPIVEHGRHLFFEGIA